MARRIVWLKSAEKERKDILEFWIKKTYSNTYSKKLNSLFKKSIKLISERPFIGIKTSDPIVRIKVVKDYLVFYEISKSEIIILTIWDSRQNPVDLQL